MKTWMLGLAAIWIAAFATREPSGPLPDRLDETGLYRAGTLEVDTANLAFAPQYPLWTDGLSKRRWIQLPGAIDGRDEHAWNLPVGTKLWKEFSRGDRKVETRMLWKVADDRWEFGTYLWNEEGTDARLAPADGVPGVIEVAPGRRHSIPSRTDCTACHGSRGVLPLGFDALQLSPDRDTNAIHGEPLRDGMITLRDLVARNLLLHSRADLLSAPPRIRTTSAEARSVLGYMAANCSMCHNGKGEIAALGPIVRRRDLVEDGDAVARSLVAQASRWQAPGATRRTVLVEPGSPDLSAIFLRMRSRAPSTQMPPLGTVLRDERAVDAVSAWIARLGTTAESRHPQSVR